MELTIVDADQSWAKDQRNNLSPKYYVSLVLEVSKKFQFEGFVK